MSDVRAILAKRDIQLHEGAYLQRADHPPLAFEEWLRNQQAYISRYWPTARQSFLAQCAAQEANVKSLTDNQLHTALLQAVKPMRQHGFRDDCVAHAFAVIREASWRVLTMRHHDVQLLAGRALLHGKIAEMATGEGKTLAATLAVCTAAATGAAVHVVTVNDYLAERDAEHNQALFELLGFSVGIVLQDMPPEQRREQYACDITYVSNKELTFDYLKDQIAVGSQLGLQQQIKTLNGSAHQSQAILRGLHVAIVDEADSVLIDEARTPLIISETIPDDLSADIYHQGIELAKQLTAEIDFKRNADKQIWLTKQGLIQGQQLCSGLTGLWQSALWRKELLQKALSALHSFHRDQHYIVVDNKVQIVDEFTGRVMPDRTWERGLHQMIEAKEQCDITGQRRTLAQITYQRFFSRYLLLAGMTGTVQEVAPEIKRVYDLAMVRIPTHKASQRHRFKDQVFNDAEQRWQAVVKQAAQLSQQGRCVLIGTRSVADSEKLADYFNQQQIVHRVLNARQDQEEALAVSLAGQAHAITIATNMAGRGTDIKLDKSVEAKGGLHVILTEFHESSRVDRQLFGRAARQGDKGSVQAIVCWQDELFTRYLPIISRFLSRHLQQGTVGRWFRWLVAYGQWQAEQEGRQTRLETVKRDRKWLEALGFVGKEKK